VGKQEIKKETPILGKVMELGGLVFIDRADGKSAINAMKPLIEVMQQEGKSVVIAPEGTRSVSPRLAPFKKGAFHLAMQAGVPIVPIVIHNAGDVAPKGDFVFRPATVNVEVLPPVDTSGWRADTIDEHVREVRNMFAHALSQPQEKTVKSKTKTKRASVKRKSPPTRRKSSATTKPKRKATTKATGKSPTKKQQDQ
jgi:putative phosphoserine phosphatase/1-acylglycerol-3-phosphate O-acyltransferase